MQKQNGQFNSFVTPDYRTPHTPSLWVSFITGQPYEIHKVDTWWTYGRFLDWLRFKTPFKWIKGKRKISSRLGLKPNLKYLRKRFLTIFDIVKPSIALFIPGYNEPVHYHIRLNDAFKKGIRHYVKTIWHIHYERVEKMREKLKEDWKLFMVWFDLPDLFGHLYFIKRKHRLYKVYLTLNALAYLIMQESRPNIMLIVSDHGMQPSTDGVTGDHTTKAFYSLNINMDWKPKAITDFYFKILELLGNEQK